MTAFEYHGSGSRGDSPMMFGQKRKTFSDFRVDLEGSGSPRVAEPLAAWPFIGFSTSWLAACAAACRRVRTPGESAI